MKGAMKIRGPLSYARFKVMISWTKVVVRVIIRKYLLEIYFKSGADAIF